MKKSQKKGSAFLLKTFDMLEEFKQIIDWISDGSGFVVKNPTQLAEKVLPVYFKHSNMHSFIRQLNMYGFNKKRGTKIQNYYFHHQFRKGQRQIISQIQRKIQKKGIHKQQKKQQTNANNQQLSIELQQSQENKQNKNEQNRRNNQIEEIGLRKKIIQLSMANKVLLLEQIYHLGNLEQNNLLNYEGYMENTNNEKDIKTHRQNNLILQKFNLIKQRYIKLHCMIWQKLNTSIQSYQSNSILATKKSLLNNQRNKQTQLTIPKKQSMDQQQLNEQFKDSMINNNENEIISQQNRNQSDDYNNQEQRKQQDGGEMDVDERISIACEQQKIDSSE